MVLSRYVLCSGQPYIWLRALVLYMVSWLVGVSSLMVMLAYVVLAQFELLFTDCLDVSSRPFDFQTFLCFRPSAYLCNSCELTNPHVQPSRCHIRLDICSLHHRKHLVWWQLSYKWGYDTVIVIVNITQCFKTRANIRCGTRNAIVVCIVFEIYCGLTPASWLDT